MARRQAWTLSETMKLIEHYNTPIQILEKIFPRHPKSSIERKIMKLRKEGKIGLKTEETIKEAYRLRNPNSKKSQELKEKELKKMAQEDDLEDLDEL